MIIRAISGLIYVIVILFCTTSIGADFFYNYFDIKISSKYLFYGLTTLFILSTLLETIKILHFSQIIYKVLTFLAVGIIYFILSKYYFFEGFNIKLLPFKYALLILLFALAIITLFRFSKELYTDSAKLIFTAAYLGVPFGLSLAIPINTDPLSPEIFYIFLLIWISDTFAYLIGKKWGKHKLAPYISPNKTVEGLIAGIISTIIAGIIIEFTFSKLNINWIVISIIIAIFAPLGDLTESKLKRLFGVKDSGILIPGHGGILDRLDSYIFCIPAIFTYYLLSTFL